MEGYGLYWYCLELIARNVEKNNLTFELEHDSEIISHDTGIHFERVQEMMQYMINLRLFENNSGAITCLKMAMRLDDTTSRHPKIKNIQDLLRRSSEETPKSIPSGSEESSSRTEQNRTEQIRREKKEHVRFAPPKLEQVRAYCLERNNNVDPEKWIDYYTGNGWKVGRNPMKDWQAVIRTWEKNDSGQDRRHYDDIDNSAPAKVRRAIAEQERQERHRREREI